MGTARASSERVPAPRPMRRRAAHTWGTEALRRPARGRAARARALQQPQRCRPIRSARSASCWGCGSPSPCSSRSEAGQRRVRCRARAPSPRPRRPPGAPELAAARSRAAWARSASASSERSRRAAPGPSAPSRSGPIRTRTRRMTGWPSASSERRICRFRPSCSVSAKRVVRAPSSRRTRATRAGAVIPSSSRMPRARRARLSSETAPRTVTSYSRSFASDGWSSAWAVAPSLVSRRSPSVSRSSRPTG